MAWLKVVLSMVLLAAVLGVPSVQAALQSHRAVYRLDLAPGQASSGGALQDVAGNLAVEWRRTCEGWISNQWLWFVGTLQDAGDLRRDVRFSSFEANDGSRMQYSVRSYNGEVVEEEYRGEAWLEPRRGGGVARFKAPEHQDVRLPPGTIFPTEHLQQVIAGALAGERVMSDEVFDGWGYDALTQITAVIGEPRPLAPAPAEGALRVWPVSMAYFDLEDADGLPQFEAAFLLQENGVLRRLTLDYMDFQLEGELETLKVLDEPDC